MDILGGMNNGGGESPYLKWKTGDMSLRIIAENDITE